MLLETWFISTLYTARGLTKYFLDYHRFLARSSAHPKDDVTLEEHLPPVEKFIELATASKHWDPPMYLNTGGNIGIGIPIGGGFTDEMKVLATFVKPVEVKDERIEPTALRVTDTDYRADKAFWVNTPDSLKHYLDQNTLNASSFPAMLPLKVLEYPVPPGATVWKHRTTGIIGSNRLAVVKAVAARRNLKTYPFLFAAITCTITTCFVYADLNSYDSETRRKLRRYGRCLGLKV